jgi:hypothetical protein
MIQISFYFFGYLNTNLKIKDEEKLFFSVPTGVKILIF